MYLILIDEEKNVVNCDEFGTIEIEGNTVTMIKEGGEKITLTGIKVDFFISKTPLDVDITLTDEEFKELKDNCNKKDYKKINLSEQYIDLKKIVETMLSAFD